MSFDIIRAVRQNATLAQRAALLSYSVFQELEARTQEQALPVFNVMFEHMDELLANQESYLRFRSENLREKIDNYFQVHPLFLIRLVSNLGNLTRAQKIAWEIQDPVTKYEALLNIAVRYLRDKKIAPAMNVIKQVANDYDSDERVNMCDKARLLNRSAELMLQAATALNTDF